MKNTKKLPTNNKKDWSDWKQAAENIGNGLAEVGKVVGMIAGVVAFAALGDYLREKRLEIEGEDE